MVKILVVNGKASHSSHLWVAGLVEVLTHHKHRIVHHTGGALGHWVHPNNIDNGYDALEKKHKVYSHIDIYNLKICKSLSNNFKYNILLFISSMTKTADSDDIKILIQQQS